MSYSNNHFTIDVFNINKYAVNFGGFGISLGFGLILCLLAGIATVATGLLAMSGGKITKGTFQELASTTKGFAQSIASSVQSPQQPGQPDNNNGNNHNKGLVNDICSKTRVPTSTSAPQQSTRVQQAPQQQLKQGFQQAPQQPQQGFQQAPQQPQQGFQQAPQQGFQQAPQQPQQGFQQAPQQAWQPQEQQQPQQPEQPTTEPGQE
ncbi:MAG: hypothetical protein ACLROH_07120 [Streptococcus sp.]